MITIDIVSNLWWIAWVILTGFALSLLKWLPAKGQYGWWWFVYAYAMGMTVQLLVDILK